MKSWYLQLDNNNWTFALKVAKLQKEAFLLPVEEILENCEFHYFVYQDYTTFELHNGYAKCIQYSEGCSIWGSWEICAHTQGEYCVQVI